MKSKNLTLFFALISVGMYAQTTTTTSYNENSLNQPGDYNIFVGYGSGNSTLTGSSNTFIGVDTGASLTSGNYNVFIGEDSGKSTTSGNYNIFNGASSGRYNTTGEYNIFQGYASGRNNTTGNSNTFQGYSSGRDNTTGSENVFIGNRTGYNNTIGENNVYLGANSGRNNLEGSRNIFIGYRAGYNETTSDKLYVDNSTTSTPLIYGDFARDELIFNGKVSTGTTSFPENVGGVNISRYTLFVEGGLLAEEVRVRTDWADYVFNDSYELQSLEEVEQHIKKYKHLPNIPSEAQVITEGIELGEITKLQQEKIEELTLYIIQQQKEINDLRECVHKILNSNK